MPTSMEEKCRRQKESKREEEAVRKRKEERLMRELKATDTYGGGKAGRERTSDRWGHKNGS